MSNLFSCIVADPPWSFLDELKMSDVPRGAAANYSLMSNQDIMNLDIKSIADPEGCILALWVPSSLLQVGLDTMKAYGFNFKQTYIWVKTKREPLEIVSSIIKKVLKKSKDINSPPDIKDALVNACKNFTLDKTLAFFMGRLFRQTHEICLIGTNNNKIYKKLKNKSQRSVSFGENLKHSAKPEHLQDSLDLMFPDPDDKKCELFARRQRPGWVCVGNQVPGNEQDIREFLKEFKNSNG